MKHPPLTPLVSILLLLLSTQFPAQAKSSGGGGGHNITVTISPVSSQLSTGQSQQFTASVSGTRYKSVVWSVNGVAGGNLTVGTVSSAGIYTAPAVAPANPVQVTAACAYQTSASASASVSISSTSTPTPVAVSVTPTSTSVPLGNAQQFSATVSGTSNTAVSWLVDGTTGGASATGTISSTGLYTAPSAMPSTAIVVTAQSSAQPTATASASVQLTAPTVSVSISPASASVTEGQTQQFSAQVSGTTNTAVNWFVSGIAGGNSTVGIVNPSGVYTAPTSVPSGQVVVTAQSAASPSNSANASVTVLAPVAHLVDLSWNATTATVAGYNIYRSTQSSGPFTKLNPSLDTATVYTDSSVVSGKMYYYAATSVDSNGVESSYSNIAQASIP
jgi:hypothetical protein